MKNSLIHSGLENKILRDFLSISIMKNYQEELNNREIYEPYKGDPIENAIINCEHRIVYNTKKLRLLKERQAILMLIKMQGWQEFDVSDYTEKSTEYNAWMTFVGTEQELDAFLTLLGVEY